MKGGNLLLGKGEADVENLTFEGTRTLQITEKLIRMGFHFPCPFWLSITTPLKTLLLHLHLGDNGIELSAERENQGLCFATSMLKVNFNCFTVFQFQPQNIGAIKRPAINFTI